MSLKRYDVEVNGHKTTLQLSDEDAAQYGLKPADAVKEKAAPANKVAKAPANKTASQSKRDEIVSRAMNAPKKADA